LKLIGSVRATWTPDTFRVSNADGSADSGEVVVPRGQSPTWWHNCAGTLAGAGSTAWLLLDKAKAMFADNARVIAAWEGYANATTLALEAIGEVILALTAPEWAILLAACALTAVAVYALFVCS